MKRLIISIALSTVILMAFGQSGKPVTIKGKVQFLNPDKFAHFNKVWLSKSKGWNNVVYDSADIAPDGSWQLTVDAATPTFYNIDIAKWDRVTVYTDSGMFIPSRGYDTAKVKIKNPPYIFIEGSADNHFINLVEHVTYRNYQRMITDSREMYFAGQSSDTSWQHYLKQQDPYKLLNEDLRERLKVLIRAYKDRPVVLFALGKLNWEKEQDVIMPVLENLNKKYPWFTDARDMQRDMEEKIAQARKLAPGMPVPVVAYNDPSGKQVSVADYKGNYLLIDFWASWCGPCRKAIPKIKDLYSKYKGKGFEVLSISIDDSKSEWEKAIKEENMPWVQTLSPDKSKTMIRFLFTGIPTLYLVDREGKIVKSYTGYSKDLEVKLKDIFGS